MDALLRMSAVEAVAALKSGDVKPSEMVEASARRIDDLQCSGCGFVPVLGPQFPPELFLAQFLLEFFGHLDAHREPVSTADQSGDNGLS